MGGPLSDSQAIQASLPVKLGGLGLRDASSHAPAAYIGSCTTTRDLVRRLVGNDYEPIDSEWSLDRLQELTGFPREELFASQKLLSENIDIRKQENLLEATQDTRGRARLHSVMSAGSGDWLQVIPSSSLGHRLFSEEFQVCAQFRLGMPIYAAAKTCSMCMTKERDVFGDHSIGCNSGPERIGRHDRLRDAIYSAAQTAALAPQKEVPSLVPGSQSRPADVFLPLWTRGRPAAVDVTVVSPLQSALVQECARTRGHALTIAEERKRRVHHAACQQIGIDFIPAAVDVFGSWSEISVDLLGRIGAFQQRRGVGSAHQLFQRLSVVLQRGNASLLLRRDSIY